MLSRAILLLLTAALVAGCGGGERAKERYRQRQAAVDPPELWSIEVVPAPPGVKPILICTDSIMRKGLGHPSLSLSGGACTPTDEPVLSANGYVQRCDLNGEAWVATSTLAGDQGRDFTASLAAGPLSDDNGGYRQVRRFKRIGPCPDGWSIGEKTDQSGARVVTGLATLVK
jgi:hypothetical protein